MTTNDFTDLVSLYGFKVHDAKWNKYTRLVDNDTNCQCKLLLRLLSDNETIRISIGEVDSDDIDSPDIFETKNIQKIKTFIDLIIE